jgi:adenylosuccinate synthase
MRKKGDTVKIKSKLDQNMYDYVPEMKKFAGATAIIISTSDDRYYLDIDFESWSWYEEYFE